MSTVLTVLRLLALACIAWLAAPSASPVSLALGPATARAADEDLRYPQLFVPQRPTRPPRERVERRRPATGYGGAGGRGGTVVVRDTPGRPAVERSVFITVFGDTLAELVGNALADAFDESPEIDVTRRTVTSSGLVRTDFYDWMKAIRETLAGETRITHAVILVGSNDRQAIKDGTNSLEPLTEAWRVAYAMRVDEIGRAFAEKNIPLYWVGLPIMENPRMAADALVMNEIFRTGARRNGATYVDLWEPFMDAQNRYSMVGPDLNGDIVKLRAGDGVHFTKLGARKAAHFVEVEIRRALEGNAPAAIIAIPTETGDPAMSDPALQPGGIERAIDEAVRRGLDGLPPVPIVIPQRPVAGPILPLTVPEATPGAQLATGAPRPTITEAGLLNERVLGQGRAPEPKPGRADDFRWPTPRRLP